MVPTLTFGEALRRGAAEPEPDKDGCYAWLGVTAPKTLAKVAGEPTALKLLQRSVAAPHSRTLLTGPPGSTKSTAACAALRDLGVAPVTLDACEEPALASCRTGGAAQGYVIENCEAPGAARRLAEALRARGSQGARIVLVLADAAHPACKTLAGCCGAHVRMGPVPEARGRYAVCMAARAMQSALPLAAIEAAVQASRGDLRAALLRAGFEDLGGAPWNTRELPRDVTEATEALLEDPDLGTAHAALAMDRGLHGAYAADRGLRGASRLADAARLSEALSDLDADPAEASVVAMAAAVRAAWRGGAPGRRRGIRGFPGGAAFGLARKPAELRAAVRRRVGGDALECFARPVARSACALPKPPRGRGAGLSADVAAALRRELDCPLARARGVAELLGGAAAVTPVRQLDEATQVIR